MDPAYYDRILKEYIFDGKTDLEIFRDWLSKIAGPINALDLGCGTGRATHIFTETCPYNRLTLVDLSNQMLRRARERFADDPRVAFVGSDALSFLDSAEEPFDVIYTLWSFSHATHQWLTRLGLEAGREEIRRILQRMVRRNMRSGSKFFLIHFDSRSDEQRVLIRQWRKVFPIFTDDHVQSPSLRIIDELLHELDRDGTIRLTARHLTGHPIVYASLEEALEIFMNFHMESYFNATPLAGEVLDELAAYFRDFTEPDGTIRIASGMFVYAFEKLTD